MAAVRVSWGAKPWATCFGLGVEPVVLKGWPLAIDLYGGKVASSREDAMAYMKATDAKAATEQAVATVGWLKQHGIS